jgi:hypothetical protein
MILLGDDPLSRFLNRAANTPFEWGSFDCLLWLADWIYIRHATDPAHSFRGKYSTMLGAAKIVRDAGGMRKLVGAQVRQAGLRRASVGERGDIAIVSVAGDGGEHFGNQAGAVMLSGSAALICQTGLVVPRIADVPVIAAWRV